MAKFVVGNEYYFQDTGFGALKILRRTEKTIWVSNGQNEWKMRIRDDGYGNEYATDSSVPKRFRSELTIMADDTRYEEFK